MQGFPVYMRRLLLCLVCVVPFMAAAPLCAEVIDDVTIEGVEGTLRDNVTAQLTIYTKKDSESLSRWRIEQMHKKAEGEIKNALKPFGYYSSTVGSALRYTNDGWRAVYTITPGKPVLVSAVTIAFEDDDGLIPEVEKLASLFPLKEGAVLNHQQYKDGKKKLLQQLAALGYVDAGYSTSEIRVHRRNHEAELELRVKTGPRYRFGKTIFDQNLLDADFLAGYINYRRGEPYSRQKLIQLQQILYATNYFGRVIVQGEVDRAEGLFIPVRVTMAEPEFFSRYSFGAGYATDDGIRGRLGWDNRLFNRFGHSVSSEFEIAERNMSLDFLYNVPVMDPRYDKVSFGVQYSAQSWEDVDTEILKATASYKRAGRRFSYGGGVELQNERYDIGRDSDAIFLPMPFAFYSMIYADDPVDTTHGVLLSVKLRGATETLFAHSTFGQVLFTGKLITSPFDGFRLISRGSLGATAVDSIDDLPPSLRFYAGGDKSVRGFGFRELATEDSSGTIIGGRYLLFGSVELEKRIYKNWRTALFYDAGKGLETFSEDLGHGVGVGVRYQLPFGQIRLDVASAISEDDNPLRLHFTIGGDF
ncbi:MAG: autotransporter assembly complex family protein [Desulfopila sp.]